MESTTLIVALATLIGTAIVSAAALLAWRGWRTLKQAELDKLTITHGSASTVNTRIELADLRERLRKLEDIAAGV